MVRVYPRAQQNIWSEGMASLAKRLEGSKNIILVFDG